MKAKDCIGLKAMVVLFVLLSFIFSPFSAVPVGKFSYRLAPETIDGDTIVVNDTLVAMSEKIRVFQEVIIDQVDTIPDTPSVFFLIDNSSSMSGITGQDPVGNRFTVTSALIDTVMAKYPQAEVGLAVFSGGLYYNPASKPDVFQTVTTPTMGLDDTGAFVPLLTLNQTYGTQTGYEILKEVLDVDTSSDSVYLSYPSILISKQGTNINSGFDAALQAFQTAKYSKENQFIVFISDGEANQPAAGNMNTFTAATNCPTTYTIYITHNPMVPNTIATYTTNCRANAYSSANSNSAAWAYNNTTFEALMKFLMQNVFSLINSTQRIDPASIVINGLTNPFPWSSADSVFLFSSLFPLQSLKTPFSYAITKSNADTTITKNINLWVKTQHGTPLSRANFSVFKWDRNLIFRDIGGTEVTVATETMDEIGLYFTFTRIDTLYDYSNVSIELCNTRAPFDKETVLLTKGTNSFSGKFNRALSDQPTPGNDILETREENDSIIAIFRNSETPALPLDTLRIAIPFQKQLTPLQFPARTIGQSHIRQIIIGSYRINLNLSVDGPFLLRICDIKGALLKQITVANPNVTLPSSLLPKKNGLYFITVATEQKRESTRVLIAR